MKKFVLLMVSIFMLLAAPAIVTAKEGFYIGPFVLPYTDVSGYPGVGSGSGYGFRAGFGFNRYFAIEGTLEMAEQDLPGGRNADLNGYAVDAKINFPLTSLDRHKVMTVEPYMRLGLADYELDWDSGAGMRFGIGMELYIFRELSVSAGWTRTNVAFDYVDARVKIIDIGLNYHFR